MRVVDWLARTTMLVLAALATLALIGSLASVSNSPIGGAFPGAIPTSTPQAEIVETAPSQSMTEPGTGTMTIEPAPGTTAVTSPPGDPEIARWLKALTYAVLALAVFIAAAVVALARIAGQLRRIADR